MEHPPPRLRHAAAVAVLLRQTAAAVVLVRAAVVWVGGQQRGRGEEGVRQRREVQGGQAAVETEMESKGVALIRGTLSPPRRASRGIRT